MSNDTKSPASETPEPQQITPQTGELDAEKLDNVSGGGGGGSTSTTSSYGYRTPPGTTNNGPPPPH